MNALTLAQQRYTTKAYDPAKKIPAETVERIIEILRLTPSSTNVQPWHFVLAESEQAKTRIAKSMLGTDDYNIPKVMNASHIIVLCSVNDVTPEHLEKVTDCEVAAGRYSQADRKRLSSARRDYVALYRSQGKIPMWVENQTHIALGQLLWAAAMEGVDSTAIGGYQFDVLDAELGLAEKGLHSSVIVTLGYRAEDDPNVSKPKARLPLSQILTVLA
ncbi:oxygen-insensitive NAD(P)H nitroreductase [Mannheimia sp. HC-2023]|uniref:Oxygen-insensitive NAD(P)H nitroreductase n=1 Tax=Mannheimia indoligenes TaxID=3103145 RepID=A0ABU7ZFZ2_9PAST